MANGRPGRPTKFSEELLLDILADIENGLSETIAVQANGISTTTWGDWKKDPEKGISGLVSRARAKGIRRNLTEYNTTNDPVRAKVCKHLLGCRDPEMREKQQVEHSGNVAVTLAELLHADVPDEDADG